MNDPVKIIDKACMSCIIDHQEEKKGLYLSLENCEGGAVVVACDNSTSDAQCLELDSVPNISDFGDKNDLIRRGDALKAIRKACISAHLPFDSATPEGKRVMDALYAVWKVKKRGKDA
jgi:hypothetical protein